MLTLTSEQAYIHLYQAVRERDLPKITRLLAGYGEKSNFSNVSLPDLEEQLLRGCRLEKVSDRVFTVETMGLLIVTLIVCHDLDGKIRYSLTMRLS